MPRTYVALDLETTGLDPDRDTIMEVGAVRFDLNGGCETFSTFVDPKQHIPYRIQCLTGISNADVAGAPQFAEIAGDFAAFIGAAPVVGQNVAFDLDFLDRAWVRPSGPSYDTQELASLLLPDLLEHSLRAIARHLEIDFPVRHRALADADAARSVFLALRERLAALPAPLLAEAERIASVTDWPLRYLLREVSDEHPAMAGAETPGLVHGAVRPPSASGGPIRIGGDKPETIDVQEIERDLTVTAPKVIEEFEERPEQVQMAHAVTEALNNSEHLLVEAGTGIGKSLAYLLPAARYALANSTRVVVSTNTINLQEQLMGKDIPVVQQIIGGDSELRAAQLKGRRNYLCLLRWSNLRRSQNITSDEAKLLVRLLLWLPHTDTGDRAEIRLSQGEDTVWNRLSAANEGCMQIQCPFVKDGSCFLLRARRRAEAAHLLVVNHALLLSDLAVGGGVIPEYDHLIVDEAQHLEAEATQQFGFFAQEGDLTTLLERVAGRGGGGLVAGLRNAARGLASQIDTNRELLAHASDAEDAVERARERLPDFFLRISGFLRQQLTRESGYEDRLLISRATRVQPDWADVELAWENLGAALGRVVSALQQLNEGLQSPDATTLLDYESLATEAADLAQAGVTLRQGMTQIVMRDDANTICWLTQQRSGDVGLASAPLRVAELLEGRLFSQKETAILTSATLTAEDSFDYMRQALGLPEANELLLGSPFDYAQSTMVLVPQDMPEPNQAGYMNGVQQALIELTRASGGRALALFTSHASLRAAHNGIKGALEEEQILALAHNVDGSPRQLTQTLREQPHTIVLGTASFWEGVDVVGEALSLLVMARLPFSVPDDPIFQARSELYEDPFNEYAVPLAVLRFKQGFGRLIRRKTDRGVMVVLDARIHSKKYGKAFLNSLPACTVRRVPLREMPDLVRQWLGDEE
ncbi:MAG: helicase C-terminal domain-containing protein [Dehalococcoidia bacterium]